MLADLPSPHPGQFTQTKPVKIRPADELLTQMKRANERGEQTKFNDLMSELMATNFERLRYVAWKTGEVLAAKLDKIDHRHNLLVREDTMDIAQNTFLRISQKIHTYKEGGGGKAWMNKICVRTTISWKRHEIDSQMLGANARTVPYDSLTEEIFASVEADPLVQIEDLELLLEMRIVFAMLSEADQVIVLKILEKKRPPKPLPQEVLERLRAAYCRVVGNSEQS